MDRRECLAQFYEILDELRTKLGGFRHLADAHGRMGWPKRGVYFFFEPGELREDARELRVVRVGTHAVSRNSRTTLWTRLSQHRGSLKGGYAGGGSHRGSVFRYLVGEALVRSGYLPPEAVSASWGIGYSAPALIREAEHAIELEVSARIRAMPFLWIAIDDSPSPQSARKLIERKSIALLSNFRREVVDPPSSSWLGLNSTEAKVRESGLWNVDQVEGEWSSTFLDELKSAVEEMD